jgi:hypothetical protein
MTLALHCLEWGNTTRRSMWTHKHVASQRRISGISYEKRQVMPPQTLQALVLMGTIQSLRVSHRSLREREEGGTCLIEQLARMVGSCPANQTDIDQHIRILSLLGMPVRPLLSRLIYLIDARVLVT